MARTLPTEDSLGLTPTDAELATVSTPADDDVPIGSDDDTPVVEAAPVVVKGDGATEPDPAATPPVPDPAAKPEDPKTVDLRALQEARAEAREAKQRNALLEARTNEMLALLNQQQTQQQQPAPANEPPTSGEPMEMLQWLVGEVQAQRMSQQEAQQRAQEATQRQEALFQLKSVEDQFRATAPDYDQAVNFAATSRDNELKILFPLATDQQRAQTIQAEWQQIVASSRQMGTNPAELIYNFAKARGFTGAAPAPAPAPVAQPDLAAVAAAQQRHQSLSDAPGGETVAPLDAKALARMSDKDFKAWMSKKGNEAKFDEIMGR